jgi:predicted PurR-regulated permease PerM
MIGHSDLTRTTLAVLFVTGLIAACFWILRPFLPAIIWATTLVVATWPIMLTVQRRLWNRRWLAVTVMTIAILVIFVIPFWLAITTIADNFDRIVEWVTSLSAFKLPPPPLWLSTVPFFGNRAASFWDSVASSGMEPLVARAAPYAGGVASWFVAALGGLGIVLVQFLLTVAVAAVMFVNGEQAAIAARRFGHRLAGQRGEQSVRLAGQAIRSVALGVVVTALAQSLLGGVGIALAGVPFAAVLTAVMFMLCLAQLGPLPLLVPAIIWLYWSGETGLGTFLLVWSVLLSTADSVVRPLLIRKGAHLPLILLLAGVIGGLIAFGLVGLFLGPVVLAVGYTLLQSWMAEVKMPDDELPVSRRS